MYLKSIEIHGFKSFANKIVFDFQEGITGIVGPNGSGKSNVADAVRWVLGEQKIKQLRGSKLEDVIFAGTSARKPQSYAFVSITMDNSDHKLNISFDEVTISRRVFRSGESEYLINGSVVRLRDVHELFYDTGIGKEGYSIIGQGQIDKILQGKPEERREIFDEAAGIVKFRKRKTVAIRKLESERQNLSRVKDILSELKRQVGPLKRQSEAAEQFVVFRNELKKYDINLFLFENGDIRARINDYSAKEENAREELKATREEYDASGAEYEKISESLRDIEAGIEELRAKLTEKGIARENMSGQIRLLEEKIRSLEEARSTFNERVNVIETRIKDVSAEKEKLLSEIKAVSEQLSDAVSRSSDKDSHVLDIRGENDELRSKIEELKEQLIAVTGENGVTNARIERIDAMLGEMKKRREELSKNLERFSSDKESREQEAIKLRSELEAETKKRSSIESDIKDYSEALKKERDIQKEHDRKLLKEQEALMKAQASLESLKNITERYEGYGNTIKEIMKLKDDIPGIHGVVADIIRTEKKYETAIETALGGSIQNIVTDTESTAKEVIEHLKKNRLGRATFLPLKAVTGRKEFRQTEAFDEKGIIGLASSLVNVDDKYKGVASYLLGMILVADNIDNALLVARKYSYSLIIVTLEGELLNRGGSLTGGAFKNRSNLLGRRREMEELNKSIDDHSKEIESIKGLSSESLKRQKELSSDIESAKTALSEQNIYLNTLSLNLKAASRRTEELEDLFADADAENKNLSSQEKELMDEDSELRSLLKGIEKRSDDIKEEILNLENELDLKKEKEAEELIKAQTLKVEISRLKEQRSNTEQSIDRAKREIVRLRSDLETVVSGYTGSDDEIEDNRKSILSIQEALVENDNETQRLKASVKELEDSREERAGDHRDFITHREELSKRVADLDKEVFRLQSMREKLEERFENKSEYIWDEYQLTYNNALELRDSSLNDARQMREKINALKSDIRKLGIINVGAIEEYKEVKERFDFLSAQHDDLIKAEADLVKIIRDLDREMRKQFNTEFAKIKAEFSKVFRALFGGGFGSIELEEDIDVLEAGISVIAQPPGKKLQNMMQLSGGEKALTAIALLFAIQNLKPSPFCILDEIEAALDDANITRFADYLRKLAKDIQFIVITHRRGTMEAADRLYGITMQERGVSTLISVDLADVED